MRHPTLRQQAAKNNRARRDGPATPDPSRAVCRGGPGLLGLAAWGIMGGIMGAMMWAAGACAEQPPGVSQPPTPCRVLIVTGHDAHHQWQRTTPVLVEMLAADPRLQVSTQTDLSALADCDLSIYHVVVLHFKNDDPQVPGRKVFDKLRRHVAAGGGLVLVHFACGAFEEFRDEYAELVGRVWMGLNPDPPRRQHDPLGPFRVQIVAPEHPVTAGLPDFATHDELYTCLIGDAEVQVLAAAQSPVDGVSYPMAMVRHYGEGRVFHCTLGHDVRALQADAVGELYRRGCAWAAGLPPVPSHE